MKKVLIISYFYPPANFVGGERTYAWAKYLHEKDIYPIIITRQWNNGQTDLVDLVKNNEIEIEYNNTHEVHRLPYKRSFRDFCSDYKILKVFQKSLTLFEFIMSNYFISALPFSNFLRYSEKLILANNIDLVIASGRPFQVFFFGYKLKKKYNNINWIPDYRDEWNSNTTKTKSGLKRRFFSSIEKTSEKRWTKNSSFFLTVSDQWNKNIADFINKKGYTIKNGFEPKDIEVSDNKDNKVLTLGYIGTLYLYQQIENVVDIVIDLNKKHRIYFYFIGIDLNNINQKTAIKISENSQIFEVHNRVSKEKVLEFYGKIDILVLTKYKGINGWYPVKLFDYYSTKKPILLYPSDNDVIEEFIKETNCGFIPSSEDKCKELLIELFNSKVNNISFKRTINENAAEKFSRRYQTLLLGELINNKFS
jgi:hypothetical protein